jgi:glutamate racemase
MSDARPIGFFDSGIGGAAVLAQVRRLLPAEDLIYFADSGNFPYGSRLPQEIQRLAAVATERLLQRDVKLIVVACNAASTGALAHLRERYSIPFVGMVPAVKPASSLSRKGRVGVLATEATARAEVLSDLILQHANGADVATIPAPQLAPLVERGADDEAILPVLGSYMEPLVAAGSDVFVLGCTHYFFLRHLVEGLVPAGSAVLDTAEPVARRVVQVLREQNLLKPEGEKGQVEYLTSGDQRQLERVLERWRRAGYEVP